MLSKYSETHENMHSHSEKMTTLLDSVRQKVERSLKEVGIKIAQFEVNQMNNDVALLTNSVNSMSVMIT